MKIEFTDTPHNSIRVYVYYDNYDDKQLKDITTIFNYLSAWKGPDNIDFNIKFKSWEFPIELKDYFLKRYPTDWL